MPNLHWRFQSSTALWTRLPNAIIVPSMWVNLIAACRVFSFSILWARVQSAVNRPRSLHAWLVRGDVRKDVMTKRRPKNELYSWFNAMDSIITLTDMGTHRVRALSSNLFCHSFYMNLSLFANRVVQNLKLNRYTMTARLLLRYSLYNSIYIYDLCVRNIIFVCLFTETLHESIEIKHEEMRFNFPKEESRILII